MKLWPFPKRAPKAPASSVPAAAPVSPVPSPVPAEALPEALSFAPPASPAPVPQEAAPAPAEPACVAAEEAPAPEHAPPCPSGPEASSRSAEEAQPVCVLSAGEAVRYREFLRRKREAPVCVLSAGEAVRYREFLRRKREAETALMLHRLVADLTSVSDRATLRAGVEGAVRLGAFGVLVTPDKLPPVRKLLKEGGKGAQRGDQNSTDAPRLFVLVGGTGETLPAVKKYEVKKAVRLGADALVFVPSVMLFRGGTVQAVRREWRPVLRAAGKRGVFVALTDPSLTREEALFGVRAAEKAGASGAFRRACRRKGGRFGRRRPRRGRPCFGSLPRGRVPRVRAGRRERRRARAPLQGGRGACVHGAAGAHRKRARSPGGGGYWRMSGCIVFRDGEGPAPRAFLGQKARGASKKIQLGRRRRGKFLVLGAFFCYNRGQRSRMR